MNTHTKKGIAAMIAARIIEAVVEIDTDAGWDDLSIEDIAQVRDALCDIATTLRESAIYHKSMLMVTQEKH